jgi:HK97 family phage prohead protease
MTGPGLERRAALELRAVTGDKPKLVGYAAVFDAASRDLGGFIEYVRPGAFRRTLAAGADVVALVAHDSRMILGRSGAGTLSLAEDGKGLAFEVDLPPTTAARDLLVSVERGDVAGASFAFRVPKGGDRWTFKQDGPAARELLDVDLLDVTVTALPAYPDTSVALRSLHDVRPPLARRWAAYYLESI